MTLTDAINILKNERPHCGRKIRYTEGDICKAFDMAIQALEQEPKSEWQHDHEILKAYSDGANEVLDKIRAEIKGMTPTYHNPDWSITDLIPMSEVLKLVGKYKTESEVSNADGN